MQNKKTPINAKGQAHGLHEVYWDNGNPYYKGSFIKGKRIGFCIWYFKDLSIIESNFYAR